MTASVVMKWFMSESPEKAQEMVPEQRWDCAFAAQTSLSMVPSVGVWAFLQISDAEQSQISAVAKRTTCQESEIDAALKEIAGKDLVGTEELRAQAPDSNCLSKRSSCVERLGLLRCRVASCPITSPVFAQSRASAVTSLECTKRVECASATCRHNDGYQNGLSGRFYENRSLLRLTTP